MGGGRVKCDEEQSRKCTWRKVWEGRKMAEEKRRDREWEMADEHLMKSQGRFAI